MRQITKDDFDTVYGIYMDETVNPFMVYDPMPKAEFRPIFEEEFLKRDYFWLFQHEGEDAGMASVVIGPGRNSHAATILTLGIIPAHQAKGLGKKIMLEIIEFLRAKGIKRIDLAAEADNERGLAFYKKLGFQIDGIMPKYIKRRSDGHYVDEVLMSIVYD